MMEQNRESSRRVCELSLKQIKAIYENDMQRDFPADELKPFSALKRMYEAGIYLGLGYWDGERLLAYAMYVKTPDGKQLLLDYYAVLPEERNQGTGSRFLQEMYVWLQDAEMILGEVENPDFAENAGEKEIRTHRIGFYRRNGFLLIGPELTCCLFGVEFRIIVKALSVQEEEAAAQAGKWLETIYHLMFPAELFGKQVLVKKLQ
ncbi:MAG: GNAT family N-acetyltransferase [Candidatus Limivivens sp.]|nr:GNAT family N-acetyltransferase [Candidatus Limivivens sp.]